MCKHTKPTPSVSMTYTGNMDTFGAIETTKSQKEREKEFRYLLAKYGLEEIRIDVLVLRYMYDLKLQEIATELNIPNASTVFYIIKRSQELLKERGYKL